MLSKLKFAQKIWMLPGVAAVALGLVLLGVAMFGRSTTRALGRIQQGYYPSVELRQTLQADLATMQRGLQDAVAASDLDGLAAPTRWRSNFGAVSRSDGRTPSSPPAS